MKIHHDVLLDGVLIVFT